MQTTTQTTVEEAVSVTTEAVLSHSQARHLAERIDTITSRWFCSGGTLSNAFIIHVRMLADAGDESARSLETYINARIKKGDHNIVPSGWR
jgi:hypothetical protein